MGDNGKLKQPELSQEAMDRMVKRGVPILGGPVHAGFIAEKDGKMYYKKTQKSTMYCLDTAIPALEVLSEANKGMADLIKRLKSKVKGLERKIVKVDKGG